MTWTGRTIPTASWTERSPAGVKYSYLTDRLGNYITDRLGNRIIVKDINGDISLSSWTPRTIIS